MSQLFFEVIKIMIKVVAKSTPTFFYNLKRRPCDSGWDLCSPWSATSRQVVASAEIEVVIGYGSGMRHLCKHLGRNRGLEISWGDQLDSQLFVLFCISFLGALKKDLLLPEGHGISIHVVLFVHLFMLEVWELASLKACTDSRQTHVPALGTQMQNTWHRCNKIELFPCGLNANSQWIRTRWCPGSLAKLANITPITN